MREESKKDLRSMTLEQLGAELAALGFQKFRTKQIYQWIHEKMIRDIDQMTNLSLEHRNLLKETFTLTVLEKETVLVSKIDGTRKYLFVLPDGNIIESVWMRYKHGNSVCISSQVGCRMGCKFCASTLDGVVRNLTAGEMLEQIYRIQEDTGERVSNVVVMGSGEPMDNYDNLLQFIHMISDPNGLCISQRNLTVSTCGIVPKMRELAEEKLQITLALSLHASDDETRKKLMPIANRYSIAELMQVCNEYFEVTGRRVTFEYSLVKGVNDNLQEAAALAKLVKNMNCHINLIPVNPIKERDFVQSEADSIDKFKKLLEKNKINVTIRREMGRDIGGACGQLRRNHIQKKEMVGKEQT
ncbi:MAG: 23S rRNA (adenine(2503)-C(2))-methyltransferase RlmN [Lachnospiraceae bacterium]